LQFSEKSRYIRLANCFCMLAVTKNRNCLILLKPLLPLLPAGFLIPIFNDRFIVFPAFLPQQQRQNDHHHVPVDHIKRAPVIY
jgi:hypothetical protein